MQSPTARPEAARPPYDSNADDASSRAAARRDKGGAGGAAAAAQLKVLDRRAAGARDTAGRDAPPRRDDAARPAAPRAAAVQSSGRAEAMAPAGRPAPSTSSLHRVQACLALAGVAGAALLFVEAIPPAVPVGLLAALLLAALYLSLRLTRPLAALGEAARAVNLGDLGVRPAAGGAGEVGEIARAISTLLDDRVAIVAQNSEQQQRLHNDIHHLSRVTAAAAAGDFSARATVQSGSLAKLADELNRALDAMAQIVHGVRTASATFAETVCQLQQSSEHVARAAARQGAGLEEATQGLRGVVQRTDAMTENARVAGEAARRATETAQEGGRLLQRVLEGLLQMRRSAQGSSARIKRLGERATEVSAIAGAISRISAQTNMLALNAAIEASRAGEHGLGFTVVADEVRKLAEDCEESAREIARLISAIQSETGEAIADLERQGGMVEQQTLTATDAAGALDRILGAAQQSAHIVGEIGQCAQQQTDEAGGLRERVHGAGQLARELVAASERAQHCVELLQATAIDLQRRGAELAEDHAARESAAT